VENKSKEVDAKRVEALAEDRGVEGTLKQGRGPMYRQRMGELGVLRDHLEIMQERANNAKKRLNAAETRIAQIERELASVDGDLAKLKAEAETADQRIRMVQSATGDEQGAKLDPARVLPAFQRARDAFRQTPDVEHLAAVQQQCGNLVAAMSSTASTKERVRSIDCDPKQAAEAAARVFALNAGLVAFRDNCAGGTKLAQYTTTDALLGFGRKCLQDSGLVSRDSAGIGARLSGIDMNRDDKAHRFVVTWNAFLDGNRLAYLALILAIGVDSLVFMAGLFGANAIRSPLSDVPSSKARSAEHLEAIVKNALGEDRLENAELALAAMKPVNDETGYHAEVDLTHYDYETARRIRKVLVAGSSIGAVIRSGTDRHERYLVRSELFEYLSVVANAARETDSEYANRSKLIQIVGVALEPERQANADTVLHYVEPMNPRHGFMAKVDLGAVDGKDQRLVRNVLNAGMTLSAVQRNDGGRVEPGRLGRLLRRAAKAETGYLIRSDLFKTLLLYRAASSALIAGSSHAQPVGQTERRLPADRQSREIEHEHVRGLLGRSNALETDDDMRLRYRRMMLEALELAPTSMDTLQDADIAAQALAAGAALRRQARAHRNLYEELKLFESTMRHRLEEAESSLTAAESGNRRAESSVRAVAAEIAKAAPALMLLPEAGLVESLIMALEEGSSENRLSDAEQVLLSRLRRLQREIAAMNPGEAEAWRRVAGAIEHLGESAVSPSASLNDEHKLH
jgi:hypothetical protein